MYYGNRAKVYIPGWWEIQKMCKGLERLKPRVGITFDCDDSYKGAPDGEEKRLHLIADEDGVWMRRYDVWDDNVMTCGTTISIRRKRMPSALNGLRLGIEDINRPTSLRKNSWLILIGKMFAALVMISLPTLAFLMSPPPSESQPLEWLSLACLPWRRPRPRSITSITTMAAR